MVRHEGQFGGEGVDPALRAGADAVTAYISEGNIRRNVATFRGAVADGVSVCAVVKAGAYGHGAGIVASAVAEEVDSLAVYTVEEAEEIHSCVGGKSILVFRPICGATAGEDIGLAAARGWHCTVCSVDGVRHIDSTLRRGSDKKERWVKNPPYRLKVHLKIDTGMGRSGCSVEEAGGLVGEIRGSAGLELVGVYTHFATADEEDLSFAREQLGRFKAVLAETGLAVDGTVIKHACNSAGALRLPEAHFDMIRPGIGLYGYICEELHGRFGLRPVMRVEAPLVLVKTVSAGWSCGYGRTFTAQRETMIGIVPVGYADGLPRALSNRAELRIGDKRAAIIGNVSMDQTIVDLSEVADPHEGMVVTVIDDDSGSFCNAQALATRAGTIPYEILTGVGARVRRVVV